MPGAGFDVGFHVAPEFVGRELFGFFGVEGEVEGGEAVAGVGDYGDAVGDVGMVGGIVDACPIGEGDFIGFEGDALFGLRAMGGFGAAVEFEDGAAAWAGEVGGGFTDEGVGGIGEG